MFKGVLLIFGNLKATSQLRIHDLLAQNDERKMFLEENNPM